MILTNFRIIEGYTYYDLSMSQFESSSKSTDVVATFSPRTPHSELVTINILPLTMLFCALLLKKTWTIAYFRIFDKLYAEFMCLLLFFGRFGSVRELFLFFIIFLESSGRLLQIKLAS